MNQIIEKEIKIPRLDFTGSWFIDAGIIGFTKIILNSFGKEIESDSSLFGNSLLEKLQDLSEKRPIQLYVALWPVAFTLWYLNKNLKENKNKIGELNEIFSKIYKETQRQDFNTREIYEFSIDIFENKVKEIFNKSLDDIFPRFNNFYINFLMFNNFVKNLFKFKTQNSNNKIAPFISSLAPFFFKDSELRRVAAMIPFDRAISKFWVSSVTDRNTLFVNQPISLYALWKTFPQILVYILGIESGMTEIRKNRYKFFYHPIFSICWKINRKMEEYLKLFNKKNSNEFNNWLETALFQSLEDELLHLEGIFSLNLMTILDITINNKQRIQDGKYISFPYYISLLMLDEKLRSLLNENISLVIGKQIKYYKIYEILSEKNFDILSIIIKNIKSYFSNNLKQFSTKKYISLLAIQFMIKHNFKKCENMFSIDSTNKDSELLLNNLKEIIKSWILVSKHLSEIIDNSGDILYLVNTIQNEEKYQYINKILRIINSSMQKKQNLNIVQLVNFILGSILTEDSWKEPALAILISSIKKQVRVK